MAVTTVSDFEAFKSAVETNGASDILLSADITFSSGVKIPLTTKSLTIDGGGHTITDMNSTAYTSALYVQGNAGDTTVTIKNANFSGRNYYGMVPVTDGANNAGVTVIISGVSYKGPQAIYNRYGTTIIENSDISIEKNGSSATPQEFIEGNRLVLRGKVNITSVSSGSALVWFPYAGAAFTVEAGAAVSISAPNTYGFYTDTAAKPAFLFGVGSSTDITVKTGLFYSAGSGAHIAASITLEKNAALSVVATASGGVPTVKCAGAVSVKDGAELKIIAESGSSPSLYLTQAGSLTLTHPKTALFYSAAGKAFSFDGSASTPNAVAISALDINYWAKAKTPYSLAGGFDDPPATAFSKASGDSVSVTETVSSSAVISVESNIADGDGGYPLTADNFNLVKSAVLSAGYINLTADALSDLSKEISGTTEPFATVKITYGGAVLSATADSTGAFTAAVTETLTVGEQVKIEANKNFLTKTVYTVVAGSVSITDLPDVPFGALAVPLNKDGASRLSDNYRITLKDTREGGGEWKLFVALVTPLTSGVNEIGGAVTFSQNSVSSVLDETPLEVASGKTSKAGEFYVDFSAVEGVLLKLDPLEVYEAGAYVSELKWSVEY